NAEATGDQRVARDVALMRVKGELRTVADLASGKRVPPAKPDQTPLGRLVYVGAAILLDPGVYRSLRIPCDQAETQESTETRERLDGESVQGRIPSAAAGISGKGKGKGEGKGGRLGPGNCRYPKEACSYLAKGICFFPATRHGKAEETIERDIDKGGPRPAGLPTPEQWDPSAYNFEMAADPETTRLLSDCVFEAARSWACKPEVSKFLQSFQGADEKNHAGATRQQSEKEKTPDWREIPDDLRFKSPTALQHDIQGAYRLLDTGQTE
ncbi:hypothetical protein FOZ62_024117, partial [Perkinsus olseni]